MQVQGESEWAQVFLQWIGSRSPVEPVQLLVSLPVAEFNALKLPSASVTIDTGTDGGTRIEITGQESEIGPPTTVTLIASTPGHYRIMPLTASKGEHTDRQR